MVGLKTLSESQNQTILGLKFKDFADYLENKPRQNQTILGLKFQQTGV